MLSNVPANREQSRVKEINEQFGSKGPNTQTDWIIHLHTTTSNMGITLIVQQNDPLALGMALYVQKQLPDAEIFYEDNDPTTNSFLCSIDKHGFLVEVGPVTQGLLRWDSFEQTRQALSHALDFIDLQLSGQLSLPSIREADVFQFTEKLHFPRDESGEIIGMIYP